MISTFAAVLGFFSSYCVDLIHTDFCHLNFKLKNKRVAMQKKKKSRLYYGFFMLKIPNIAVLSSFSYWVASGV